MSRPDGEVPIIETAAQLVRQQNNTVDLEARCLSTILALPFSLCVDGLGLFNSRTSFVRVLYHYDLHFRRSFSRPNTLVRCYPGAL